MISRLKLITLPLTAFLLAACGSHETHPPKEKVELPAVQAKLYQISSDETVAQVQITGVVRPADQAVIAPKVMGTIREFPVNLGQSVKKGQLLASIDAAEIDAKVTQAQTQLRQARRDLEREQRLLEKEASTEEGVRNLEDRVTLMEAMVKEAEVMLGYTQIKAPFEGTVSRVYADEGSLAAPGHPLLELEASGGFEIEANIPESLFTRPKEGTRFQASLPSSNTTFPVTVKEVSPSFDDQSRSIKVRFAVPGETEVLAGQFARISLPSAERTRILAPMKALSKLGQMERVFVNEAGHARLRLVRTGAQFEDFVEILSGLDAGETVVVDPAHPLADGQPLTIIQ